jgi:hypothetical protein
MANPSITVIKKEAKAWAAHDMTHLHQLSRVLAHQYREAVGPWNGDFGVFQCAGHGFV